MTGQEAMLAACLGLIGIGLFSVVHDVARKGFRRTGGQR